MGGMPSVGKLAIPPKTRVKTIVVKIGLMKNHKGPKTVCLKDDIKISFYKHKNQITILPDFF